MDFQKQFDTVTGALNIFDMSYLVSGTTMLGVLVYAFPGLKDFCISQRPSNSIYNDMCGICVCPRYDKLDSRKANSILDDEAFLAKED